MSRLLVGEPLRSDRLGETLLPKLARPAGLLLGPALVGRLRHEHIVLVLGPRRPRPAALTPCSARPSSCSRDRRGLLPQTCYAYPNGGGAYAVSRANLGEDASLVAATSLLIDYVLTVAVSVVAGVAAITSAVPSLAPHAVALSLAFVLLLTAINLRGVKESGRAFAIPTYGFVLAIYAMLAVASPRSAFGDGITERAKSTTWPGTDRGMRTVSSCLARSRRAHRVTGVERSPTACPASSRRRDATPRRH